MGNTIKRTKGFTLIELTLSIAFITVLSLAVALIITNSISAYHRGLILNQINTTGMELVDDMRAAIQNTPVVSMNVQCDEDYSGNEEKAKLCKKNSTVVRRMAEVKINNKSIGKNVPVYGALCTGNYSYVWNSGYFYNSDDFEVVNTNKVSLKYNKGEQKDKIRLLKVKDQKRSICMAYDSEGSGADEINVTGLGEITEDPIELLPEDSNLALYDLYAPSPADGRNNMYYFVSFVLGTLQGGPNVTAQGNYCATPEGLEGAEVEAFDYCAINKFNFAAQATGIGGE